MINEIKSKKAKAEASHQEKEREKTIATAFQRANQKITQIHGILTSRIEKKPSTDTPAYGFFQFEGLEYDLPIIFRIKESCQFHTRCLADCRYKSSWTKPPIPKGSQVILEGYFTKKAKERPSFTCLAYEVLKDAKIIQSHA